jgi:hypothetical protein
MTKRDRDILKGTHRAYQAAQFVNAVRDHTTGARVALRDLMAHVVAIGIGADEESSAADEVLGRLAKQAPEPRKTKLKSS